MFLRAKPALLCTKGFYIFKKYINTYSKDSILPTFSERDSERLTGLLVFRWEAVQRKRSSGKVLISS